MKQNKGTFNNSALVFICFVFGFEAMLCHLCVQAHRGEVIHFAT